MTSIDFPAAPSDAIEEGELQAFPRLDRDSWSGALAEVSCEYRGKLVPLALISELNFEAPSFNDIADTVDMSVKWLQAAFLIRELTCATGARQVSLRPARRKCTALIALERSLSLDPRCRSAALNNLLDTDRRTQNAIETHDRGSGPASTTSRTSCHTFLPRVAL